MILELAGRHIPLLCSIFDPPYFSWDSPIKLEYCCAGGGVRQGGAAERPTGHGEGAGVGGPAGPQLYQQVRNQGCIWL